jgi:hypothetical protein
VVHNEVISIIMDLPWVIIALWQCLALAHVNWSVLFYA